MSNFRELSDEEQKALGIDSCLVTYLYSSGNYMPWIYWMCDSCDTIIICRYEDVEHFLSESKNMKCPECGESIMENSSLSVTVKVKEFLPILNTI